MNTKLWNLPDVGSLNGSEYLYVLDTGELLGQRDRRGTLNAIFQALLNARFGSLRVSAAGDGTQINALYRASATIDPASIASYGVAVSTITVTGAQVGDQVMANATTADLDGLIITARVTSANTVTVRYFNATNSAIDPPSHTMAVTVFR